MNRAVPVIGWARTPVAPVGGALSQLQPHELGAPLVQALLARSGLPAQAIDAVVLGNALGAGGNPARMLALAAGLHESCAAYSVDTQCCAGLDAITLACGLLASGQARVVLAGGAEAWSRAPIRQHRHSAVAYERPAFAPWPERDPDMLQAAADHAQRIGCTRVAQDAHALQSHARAAAARAAMAEEIIALQGLDHDAYPRALRAERVARMPVAALPASGATECAISTVAISPRADGAALLLLATPEACREWGLQAAALWRGGASVGGAPEAPMLCAATAARQLLDRLDLGVPDIDCWELHDAFAVQALDFRARLGLAPEQLNTQGGGLARGHPIGASGAVAAVRVLARLQRGQRGLACIAGAGGLGAAAVFERAGIP
ncbi:thiolase family protein [Comamonas endophytica]|uniref:Thiolase family protein n=1 Tax=Comamonas endophytica TaxID=2949090 RepID=A0ABY6GEN1_9BURK|nr:MULTISPECIES: thiolase family protein [unclassified Acidovorax]MCD2511396.1 thiolase family protein [Acidovorax sp. D4N7]UYG53318.1 thiolase family protein [Acidovorax sp. 5MLIR]